MAAGLSKPGDELYCPTCEQTFARGDRCPSDNTRLVRIAATRDQLIGRELDGRYTILEQLGAGGMGAVYRGTQHQLGREVAIKVVTPSLVREPVVIKRFLREAKLASRLSHPNAVSVLDFGQTDDGLFFLVMELVKGRTLEELVHAEGKLSPQRIVRIGTQICDALEGAHALQVIHRDLKPQNVMVMDTGRDLVKVLDFGLAKSLSPEQEGNTTMTNAGALLGTPAFMPPELVNGLECDARSDLYSLGCILYVCAAARLPFASSSVHELMAMHAAEPAQRIEGLPHRLWAIIDKLLEKEPLARYQTATELREALEAALIDDDGRTSRPVIAGPAPTMLGWDGSGGVRTPAPARTATPNRVVPVTPASGRPATPASGVPTAPARTATPNRVTPVTPAGGRPATPASGVRVTPVSGGPVTPASVPVTPVVSVMPHAMPPDEAALLGSSATMPSEAMAAVLASSGARLPVSATGSPAQGSDMDGDAASARAPTHLPTEVRSAPGVVVPALPMAPTRAAPPWRMIGAVALAGIAAAVVAFVIVKKQTAPSSTTTPQPASSQPASAQSTSPQPTSPQSASSQSTSPQPPSPPAASSPASSPPASPQPPSSQPASSQSTSPQPTSPPAASSPPASPQPPSSQPASSQSTSPQPTSPPAASSPPASPQPPSPPAASSPASSPAASPQPPSSQPASSQSTSPQPKSSQSASSQSTSPQPTSSQSASSQSTSPQPTSPQPTSPQPKSPHAGGAASSAGTSAGSTTGTSRTGAVSKPKAATKSKPAAKPTTKPDPTKDPKDKPAEPTLRRPVKVNPGVM